MCPAVPMARVLLPMLPKSICAPPLAIFASAGRHQQPQPDQLTEMFPGSWNAPRNDVEIEMTGRRIILVRMARIKVGRF
jgi:hypothetical protein